MPDPGASQPVMQFRVALTTSDIEQMTRFYTEGLGLQPAAFFENNGGHAVMVELGQATLEIFDEPQAAAIDNIEVGRRVSGPIRFALQVPVLETAVARLLECGASLVHGPVRTPWGDDNVRLQAPDGMQITLFQAPPDGLLAGA